MRILFLRSNSVNPDSRVEKEVLSLKKYGYEVDIFCWERESNHKVEKGIKQIGDFDVDIYRVGIYSVYGAGFKKNIFPLLKFQSAIYKFILKNHKNYDVIHACDFDTSFAAYYAARKFNTKLVYDVFDYYVDSFNVPRLLRGFIKRFDTKIMNVSAAVIICSDERRAQIGNIAQQNIFVIHNSPSDYKLDLNTILQGLNLDENPKDSSVKVAYVGVLNDSRLLLEILNVFAKNTNYHFYIGGFGKYESVVRDYADKYANIHFFGRIPYDKTLALESYCDVLTAIYDPAIPNHKYAAPNKFYESLMLGKPVIMVKETGMSQYVQDNNLGVLIEYSESGFLEGLKELEKKRSQWREMGIRGKQLYKDSFSWETMEDRLISLYKNI